MIPTRALPDLLAAERGLARADALFGGGAIARRHACDGARRDALGLCRLDGTLVAAEDLLLALASPDEVELPRRADAAAAAGLYRLLLDLHDGLRPYTAPLEDATEDARLRPETVAAWSALTTETRRLLAEAEAALDGGDEDGWDEGGAHPGPLLPWTLAWAEEIHARWHHALHGRRPAAWNQERREAAGRVLHMIEEALSLDPSVAGASRALHRLHHAADLPALPGARRSADEDERSQAIRTFMANQPGAGWWPQFARIVAPQLLARACRLDGFRLPLAAGWARDHTGYRLGIASSEEEWIATTTRLVADMVVQESDRAERIEARHAGWAQATAEVPRLPRPNKNTKGPTRRQRAGTRRSTGRLPLLLDLLWELPLIRVRTVEARLGMTYRSALDLIEDLETADVLRLATERKQDRLWRAAVL